MICLKKKTQRFSSCPRARVGCQWPLGSARLIVICLLWFTNVVADIPATKLVEAHGTFSTASCIRCHKNYDGEQIKVRFKPDEG